MAARAEGRDPVNRVPSLPDVRLSHSSPRSISRPVASQPVPPRTITAGSKALRCGAWFNHSVSSAPERSSAVGLGNQPGSRFARRPCPKARAAYKACPVTALLGCPRPWETSALPPASSSLRWAASALLVLPHPADFPASGQSSADFGTQSVFLSAHSHFHPTHSPWFLGAFMAAARAASEKPRRSPWRWSADQDGMQTATPGSRHLTHGGKEQRSRPSGCTGVRTCRWAGCWAAFLYKDF